MSTKLFSTYDRQGALVVAAMGPIGSLSAAEVRKEAEGLMAEVNALRINKVVFDMDQAEYFGSQVLELMILVWRYLAPVKGSMALCRLSPAAQGDAAGRGPGQALAGPRHGRRGPRRAAAGWGKMKPPDMSHLLIIDDEQSICWGLSQLAAELGHRATTAVSAEQGLAAAAKDRPDMIMLDIRLPGMDGLAAMQRFQKAAPACRSSS